MKNQLKCHLLFAILASMVLLQSCKNDDIVTATQVSDRNRIELSSMKDYGLLMDSLAKLSYEETVRFATSKIGSDAFLHKRQDTIYFDGKFEYRFPKSFASVLNDDLEFQIADKIAWFHKGYLFLIPLDKKNKFKDLLSNQVQPSKYAESSNLECFYLTTGIEKGVTTHSKKSARTDDGPSYQVSFSPGTRFLAYSSNVSGYKREIYFNCNDWYNSYNGEYLYQIFYTVEYQQLNFSNGQWENTNPTSGYIDPFHVYLEGNVLNGTNLTTSPSVWTTTPSAYIYDFFSGILRYHYYNLPGRPTNVSGHLVFDSYFEYNHPSGTISGNIDLW